MVLKCWNYRHVSACLTLACQLGGGTEGGGFISLHNPRWPRICIPLATATWIWKFNKAWNCFSQYILSSWKIVHEKKYLENALPSQPFYEHQSNLGSFFFFFFRIFIKLINCVFIFLIPKAVSSTRGAGYPIVRAHVLYMGQESGLFSCFNKVLLISWYC